VKAQSDRVKDYSAVLTASVQMERLKIPEMKVKVYFKQPDKIHVESKGFSMLPRDGIFLNPSQLLNKFTAELVSTEKTDGGPVYIIQLTPRADQQKNGRNRPPVASKIRVDGKRWLVTKFESTTQGGGSITVEFKHGLVNGTYWLPEQITAVFDVPQRKDESQDEPGSRRQALPRKGTISMTYSDYQVNTGLPDELFEPKRGEKDK
jgi:outer membrane lipoprotein-sorting protein